jgi:hypothetical protein
MPPPPAPALLTQLSPHCRDNCARCSDEPARQTLPALPALITAASDRAGLRFLEFFAARRHLFYWLVTGQVVPVNPAASVRGPRHQGNRSLSGSTPARDRSASAGATDAFTRRMKSGPMKA